MSDNTKKRYQVLLRIEVENEDMDNFYGEEGLSPELLQDELERYLTELPYTGVEIMAMLIKDMDTKKVYEVKYGPDDKKDNGVPGKETGSELQS